jgi:hypothetical protein
MLNSLLGAFLYFALTSGTSGDASILCLRSEDVAIAELWPPVHLATASHPREKITIRLPVDCHTREWRKPASVDEAVEWLDLGLPLDFKLAALKGDYIDPYLWGGYGASTNRDLSIVFYRAWKLETNSPFCSSIRSISVRPDAGCFDKLVYRWREEYLRATTGKPRRK